MRRWRGPLIVSVVYLALWLGLDAIASLFQARQEVSLWYPPTGLSFALLLVFGLRYAPLLLLTDPLHGLVVSPPAVSWVSFWLGGVLSTVVYTTVAWLLLRRLRIDPRLTGQRDVTWFLGLAAGAGPFVVAAGQVLQYTVAGLLPWGELFRGVLGFWSSTRSVGWTSPTWCTCRSSGSPSAAGSPGWRSPSSSRTPSPWHWSAGTSWRAPCGCSSAW